MNMSRQLAVLITVLLYSSLVTAAQLNIIGPCSDTPLAQYERSVKRNENLGEFTIKTLEENSISYQGTADGINSIFDTPTGLEAIEVLGPNEMLAYGWCYSINGHEPAVFPSEIVLNESDSVTWWFGYAHMKDDEWIEQCAPSYTRRSTQFCPDNK